MTKFEEIQADVFDLWNAWEQVGINFSDKFNILFQFYTVDLELGKKFAERIADEGYSVKTKTRRFLLFWKEFVILPEKNEIWTKESVVEDIMNLLLIGEPFKVRYQGMYAQISEDLLSPEQLENLK